MACNAYLLLDTYNIVWDSRALMCISNDKCDFPDDIQPITNTNIDRFTSHLQLEGVGNVSWRTLDTVRDVLDIIFPPIMPLKHINICLVHWYSANIM